MAERRMFAKSIINSGKFLRMPPTSRLLYYDLGMFADDDGVVEAFSVMRQTNATEDDLRVLVTKGFVTILNDDLVALISDWNVNNFIRNDRYHPSIYKDLVLRLTAGIPDDNQATTDGRPRLGKVSIGKDSIDKESKGKRFTPPTVEEVREYVTSNNYNVDADNFVDFYESKGWLVGKNKMKDWKAAVRTWARRDNGNNTGTSNTERSRVCGADAGSRAGTYADRQGVRRNFIPMAEMSAEEE